MKEDIKGAEETAETEASEIPIADGIDEMESGGKEDKEALVGKGSFKCDITFLCLGN